MKTFEFTGKTVESALENALSELKVSKDKVEYSIADEGSKGLFSFIGTRPARISVTLKRTILEEIELFLKQVLIKIGRDFDVIIKESDKLVQINIEGEKIGDIIGYRGETLDSLQYLLNIFANKKNCGQYKKIILDVGDYRLRREETLKKLALKTAYKVNKYRRVMKFEPMNSYERKIIHSTLQNDRNIFTYSEGKDPFRRVVINLKKEV